MKQFVILSLFTVFIQFAAAADSVERLIVFGDSLSDQGTYTHIAKPKGGGKFTTNPGKLWIEIVAQKMNLPISENRHEGFGLPVHILGGFNYAQGGARISKPIQIDLDKGYSARPVTEQISLFLNDNKSFQSTDLVFVLIGANDILNILSELAAGHLTAEQAVKLSGQAAGELAIVIQNLIANKAEHVAVLNLPMIERTPKALALDPEVRSLISAMTQTFNHVLQAQLATTTQAHVIDLYAFDQQFNLDPASYGIENVTETACQTEQLPAKSSLFCSAKNLVKPDADQKYKFADSIHPATGFSKIIGDFIWTEVQKLGL